MALNITGYCTYSLERPEEIPLIWAKYFPLLLQEKHEFHHALNWFMRSLQSNDPIDKFIYAWITLNCLYGYLYNADGHRKGIRSLIYNNIPVFEVQEEIVHRHKLVFEYLSSLDLIDKRNKRNWSKELLESLTAGDISGTIENGISAIAIIRHTIFHGNTIDRKNEVGQCIRPLLHLNAEILRNRLFD